MYRRKHYRRAVRRGPLYRTGHVREVLKSASFAWTRDPGIRLHRFFFSAYSDVGSIHHQILKKET